MNLFPRNIKYQRVQTDVRKLFCKRSYTANFEVSAANAVATSNTAVLAAKGLLVGTQEVTTNITNPLVPRNIIIKGNAAGIAGDVTIIGTNIADQDITETIALNEDNAVEGLKAFKTVTQINLPIKTNASGDTVSVGFGDKLGLPFLLPHNTVLFASLNNVRETTAPTVTTSITAIESNTVELNSALDGSIANVYLLI